MNCFRGHRAGAVAHATAGRGGAGAYEVCRPRGGMDADAGAHWSRARGPWPDRRRDGRGGVGKSRLFFEFKAVAQSGCLVLEAYSVSHGKASAYLPVIDLLRDLLLMAGRRRSAAAARKSQSAKYWGSIRALGRHAALHFCAAWHPGRRRSLSPRWIPKSEAPADPGGDQTDPAARVAQPAADGGSSRTSTGSTGGDPGAAQPAG